jgi:hypothetical protein
MIISANQKQIKRETMITGYLQRENMDGDSGNKGLEPGHLPVQGADNGSALQHRLGSVCASMPFFKLVP